MGKHEAPEPPVKVKLHWFVRLCTHHAGHAVGAITLHVIAFTFATPILIWIGFGEGH